MDETAGTREQLAARFEGERDALAGLAHRLLGSRAAAEDAVQDAWLRLTGADVATISNLPGWLRVVVTRLCLDQLRSRRSRREQPVDDLAQDPPARGPAPDELAATADDVSRVLLVVLDALSPAERVAVVAHDMFAVPYAEIAPLVERSTEATKKLAARARAKVRGRPSPDADELRRQRVVVERFLTAARAGDVDAVLAVLAPDVTRTADPRILPPDVPATLVGARAVAEGTALLAARSRRAELALLDGRVGLAIVEDHRLRLAVIFDLVGERIARYRVVTDPDALRGLEIHPLDAV